MAYNEPLEKIGYLSNGQWFIDNLNKGVNQDPRIIDGYMLPQHGEILTGKHAERAQQRVVQLSADLPFKGHKVMPRVDNGKPELHILIHRGIARNVNKRSKGRNMLNMQEKGVVSSHYPSVHTLSPFYASSFTHFEGKVHSFWVPISDVIGDREYIKNAKFMDPKHPDPVHPVTGEKLNREKHIEKDPFSRNHVVIKPGRWRRATKQEIGDIHKNYEKWRVGATRQQHTHFTPIDQSVLGHVDFHFDDST